MRINSLAIEVTRKCNIKCAHCLRGNAQNKNIPLDYIDMLLDQVESIGHFCPTGGEPSLNTLAIQYFTDECIKRNISLNTFHIATNGIKLTDEFVNACISLYELCRDKKNSHVQTSNDVYHLAKGKYNDNCLQHLSFYSKRYPNDNTHITSRVLHREGRMINNTEALLYSSAEPITSKEIFHKNTLYLNVNGDILDGPDWSYENQEKHIISRVESLKQLYNLIA